MLFADILKGSDRTQPASRTPIRKHHWVLGTLVVLTGSWITHTTTATIKPLPDAIAPTAGALELSNDAENISEISPVPSNDIASLADLEKVNIETLGDDLPLAAPIEVLISKQHVIKSGESLGVIFRKEGLGYSLPHKLAEHPIAGKLTSITVGKALTFKFDQANSLRQIRYPTSYLTELVVDIQDGEITGADVRDLAYSTHKQTASAEITSSLYEAAMDAKLSNNITMDMVKIFGWDIDFVQDIRVGDRFHVVYEDHRVGDKKVADGDILAAEFTTQGQTYRAIRFVDQQGEVSYYTPEGDSMLGTFLRSPVEFSRISSRFGKRRHPISKKWKTHKGVDYAASRGTPIIATADGKVIHAGNKGGYGKTIVLRHAGRFTTLYAHMNGFAKGVKSGTRVKQGQTIGYVGTTGYSTGPHLHYEFQVDGVHRNSLTYKTPKASSVKPEDRKDFEALVASLSKELDSVQTDYLLAKAKSSTTLL
ncbi:M23 family metallopeptidase [Arenicella xantha]|uniref:Murein DD-endopeptidase MepM/ murein hydrolase activator NlpD n=1 Tax=Arenicella xantha TaxID=644221 RepID=A0A395JM53_9GAMM|nr:M23 family metallopeptidase [Arenicella xantha]RBP52629.1 murein DD-endopeptidase MepM/ murein hydrolase activator NlpD [Arenicella xantha]